MSAKMLPIISLVAVASTAFAGLASAAEPPVAPDPRIGEEVDRVCFVSTIHSWRAIKGEDRVVLLEKGVNDWYRAEVTGPCSASDFNFAETIAIESHPGGGCLTRGDVIIVRGPGDLLQRCHITKLNEWNDKAAPAQDEMKESDQQ